MTCLCPICQTECHEKVKDTPYWRCDGCGVWHQQPMPKKVWHGPHEGPPEQMSEQDKGINAGIAEWLLREAMGGKPGPTLDIGAAYPYLASCLKKLGCFAWAMEGDDSINKMAGELGVSPLNDNFEEFDLAPAEQFRLITFIHSFEHLYDPVAAMKKLRRWIADDGAVFIRMPDNQVQGIERDLTPGHYMIHPFVHALSSIAELCAQTGTFRIERTYELLPGQRDMLLRPL